MQARGHLTVHHDDVCCVWPMPKGFESSVLCCKDTIGGQRFSRLCFVFLVLFTTIFNNLPCLALFAPRTNPMYIFPSCLQFRSSLGTLTASLALLFHVERHQPHNHENQGVLTINVIYLTVLVKIAPGSFTVKGAFTGIITVCFTVRCFPRRLPFLKA